LVGTFGIKESDCRTLRGFSVLKIAFRLRAFGLFSVAPLVHAWTAESVSPGIHAEAVGWDSAVIRCQRKRIPQAIRPNSDLRPFSERDEALGIR
jgi:hypothetical protein